MERLKDVFEQVFDKDPFIGPLIFLDTETTGLSATDRVIEIGALSITFDGIQLKFQKFEKLLNPELRISDKITELTGITNDDLEKAAKEMDVYYDFNEWLLKINPKLVIAHYAKFDEEKLRYNYNRMNLHFFFQEKFTCTRNLAIKCNLKTKDHKLNTIGEFYNFTNERAHRAMADIEVCAYIWAKMYLENNNAG